jgi:hypothetical protein
VRIDPIARGAQGEATFDQAGDKNRAKMKTAHISGFQNTQAATFRGSSNRHLNVERASHFTKKSNNSRFLTD